MFLTLAAPEWIDHPVTRHVLGRRGEGRWSRKAGILPIVVWSMAPVALLIIAREMLFPRDSWVRGGSTLVGVLALLPLVAAAAAAAWQGSVGFGRLNRDPMWRELVASGVSTREAFDGMCVGLALRAVIVPTLLFQAITLYFAMDGTLFPHYGPLQQDVVSSAFFRWLFVATIFLVAAGPALDFSLMAALSQTAAGRGSLLALASGAGHFVLAIFALVVGLGVFGVVFLVVRADAMRNACYDGMLNLMQEEG